MMTVHEVASLAGVSVRTLHYYDELGLLPPSKATEAGYRLYDDPALERLQRILFLRELEFPLKDIGRLLTLEERSRREAIARHRELLSLKQSRLQGLIDLCDRMLNEERVLELKSFNETAIEKARNDYADEVKQRWGDTAAYAESETRAAKRGKGDWNAVQTEADAILTDAAKLVGSDPAGEAARALAARWQAHITAHYYECTNQILSGLADMYVADERFTVYLDNYGAGTAKFLAEAIRAYCA